MALKTFNVGEVLAAADVNEYCVNLDYAVKGTSTTRTGTTISADPDLSLSVDASKSYLLDMHMQFTTGGGVKWNFSAPSGSHLYGEFIGWQNGQGLAAGAYDGGIANGDYNTTMTFTLSGGTNNFLVIRGILVTGSSSGSVTWQWAQNSATLNTQVYQGSSMSLVRVA